MILSTIKRGLQDLADPRMKFKLFSKAELLILDADFVAFIFVTGFGPKGGKVGLLYITQKRVCFL